MYGEFCDKIATDKTKKKNVGLFECLEAMSVLMGGGTHFWGKKYVREYVNQHTSTSGMR